MTEKELQRQLRNLSWNVYALRRNTGMSIRELSKRSGVSSASISRIELGGGPRASSLILIADALGVAPYQMLTERFKLEVTK